MYLIYAQSSVESVFSDTHWDSWNVSAQTLGTMFLQGYKKKDGPGT